MQRNDIAAIEQLSERIWHCTTISDLHLIKQRIIRNDLHAQGLRNTCYPGTNFTQTDETQRLFIELGPHEVFTGKAAGCAQAPIGLTEAPRAIEHQPDGRFSH
ncbi:hypothetical protein D3C78_1698450 [compost metagenome]